MGFSQLHSGNQCLTTSFPVNNSPSFAPILSYPSNGTVGPMAETLSNPSGLRGRFPVSEVNPCTRIRGYSPALSTFVPGLPAKGFLSDGVDIKPSTLSTSVPSHFESFNFSKSPCKKTPTKSQLSSFKLFLKSPKQDKATKGKVDVNKTPIFENKKKVVSPTKTKKWYKQPFQKFGQKRTDSFENEFKSEVKRDMLFDKNLYFVSKENTASPRQRNRIKTNPWLPTEPMSSQNFQSLQINFSPSLPRNRSCTNTPLQNRKTDLRIDTLQLRQREMNTRREESKPHLSTLENVVSGKIGQKLFLELSDHSEEDVTLNEMMGTYNESYVYEKETDILSDSDPTDCEDYVSDSEADNGGDEQDSHDDELDFIDNGSITETDDNCLGNTGKCTYHDVYIKKNSFLCKSDRHHSRKDSDGRKSLRKDKESKSKRSKEERKKRSVRKSLKSEEEEARKRSEGKPKPKVELNENIGGLNLSRVLMHRMMAKNGSKSADGTPVSVRRQNLLKELRETHIGPEQSKVEDGKLSERLNRDAYVLDLEGDKKYRELIEEAENIYQSIQNSPIFQNRKKITFAEGRTAQNTDKQLAETVDIWKKAEKMCCPTYPLKEKEKETPVRKSPKHLGLKLSMDETPKKLKYLEFGKEKKSSFKAKSSAHSPLDPLGPTFRNFTVFKPVNIDDSKISLSSSEESEPSKPFKPKLWDMPETNNKSNVPTESAIVPIAFQSIDLGRPITSYCPQSEPVKRKIYTCSKTYDKLVKKFENTPKIFEESTNIRVRHGSLMTKRKPEGPESKYRISGKRDQENCDPPQKDTYAYGGVSYPMQTSPRLGSMPSSGPSPLAPHRHLFSIEAFR
ncbi:hypothetical protein RUM44_002553 [Polyplax serrata]|uniref:Uncharacterized protein n=1 Tax=Polyplax serrata TaxID=468196 RepID=A0ABR1AF59_POLSC